MTPKPTILFAGGGTGGHIFPNLAVLQRVREMGLGLDPRFVVSARPIDHQILDGLGLPHTAIPAVGFTPRPHRLPGFVRRFRQSQAIVRRLIQQEHVTAMIATGGFVSGPAVAAAARLKIPVALVSLDAVPGRANRWAAGKASDLFTVYATDALPARARRIGFPLRREVIAGLDPAAARRRLGLDPNLPTLLITAGSQGAQSVNRAMVELVGRPAGRDALAGWQVLHLAGHRDGEAVGAAYESAGVAGRVLGFCEEMGPAWSAASLAISRAGAGSVAEVLAGGVPTVFLPYPFHKDQHQRHNAAPLVDAGGAVLLKDHVDPAVNADHLAGPLAGLLSDPAKRDAMRAALGRLAPEDGAIALARWVAGVLAH